MRLVEIHLYKRLLDHSSTNEPYELEVLARGTKEELQKIQKLLVNNNGT